MEKCNAWYQLCKTLPMKSSIGTFGLVTLSLSLPLPSSPSPSPSPSLLPSLSLSLSPSSLPHSPSLSSLYIASSLLLQVRYVVLVGTLSIHSVTIFLGVLMALCILNDMTLLGTLYGKLYLWTMKGHDLRKDVFRILVVTAVMETFSFQTLLMGVQHTSTYHYEAQCNRHVAISVISAGEEEIKSTDYSHTTMRSQQLEGISTVLW